MILSLSYCSAEAEGTERSENEFQDQLIYSFLLTNNLIAPQSYYWEGVANMESCIGTQTQANLLCPTLLQQSLESQQVNYPDGFRLILQVNPTTNTVSGNMVLWMPHFNVQPFPYEFGVSGTLASPSSNTQYANLVLVQTSATNLNEGYALSITGFAGEDRPEALVGSFSADLSATGISGTANTIFNFRAEPAL